MGSRLEFLYGVDQATDAAIRNRFGHMVNAAIDGCYADWEDRALSRLALILLLDQFTRNVYRGRAEAFAGDTRALRLALGAIDRGLDRKVDLIARGFFYLPLQHAEDPCVQDRSVSISEKHDAECMEKFLGFTGGQAKFARDHRDIVLRFGRFPHRNEALGRPSTAEELAYLAGGARTYGQDARND